MINGTTRVYVNRGGVSEHVPLSNPYTNEKLTAAIERAARILGQDQTSQHLILNTRLPAGSRVAVVGPPASINGPSLTIRKSNKWFTYDELVQGGSMTAEIRDPIANYIMTCKNGSIAGGTGLGKTTLMHLS
jgi:pilus assembly protein CpaF